MSKRFFEVNQLSKVFFPGRSSLANCPNKANLVEFVDSFARELRVCCFLLLAVTDILTTKANP